MREHYYEIQGQQYEQKHIQEEDCKERREMEKKWKKWVL
jgi:hypothetical protein